MKITGRQAESFLNAPPAALRAVLFYGPDGGKVREFAQRIGKGAGIDLADPFNVVEIGPQRLKEDPSAIADEAAALSLMGGRRLVKILQAADPIVGKIEEALNGKGDALIVLEGATSLSGRSKLVKLLEGLPTAAAMGCYPDEERDLPGFVRAELQRLGVRADGDNVGLIAQKLGPDRGLNRQEMEKLALGADENGQISQQTVGLLLGDSAEADLDALCFAVLEGRLDRVLTGFTRLSAENVAGPRILSAVSRHVDRMHRAQSLILSGATAKEALGQVGFRAMLWKLEPSLVGQLKRWPERKLAWAASRLLETDAECRRTGSPAATLTQATLFDLANAARRQA